MGGEYNGAGITLGPGLTFGYVADNHIADHVHATPATPVAAAAREPLAVP